MTAPFRLCVRFGVASHLIFQAHRNPLSCDCDAWTLVLRSMVVHLDSCRETIVRGGSKFAASGRRSPDQKRAARFGCSLGASREAPEAMKRRVLCIHPVRY